ncbi:hypothetical protein CPB97_001934 [Podila verticillata]|nr:hypothetical protein CPB97_001934 [Podila verticillata]
MSLSELDQLKPLASAEVNSPKELWTRQNAAPATVSNEFRDIVFSLPELQAVIMTFLTIKDLAELMQTCQAWFDICAAALYKKTILTRHERSTVYPRLEKYGVHVRELELYHTSVDGALHVIENTPNLEKLDLSYSQLSGSELDKVFSSVPGELAHLKVQLGEVGCDPYTIKWSQVQQSLFPEPMFHSAGHLRNLQSLHWDARGMTIHVDDILRVLRSCPRLVSLYLVDVRVVYEGHDSPLPSSGRTKYFDRPGPFVPISDEDLDTLDSGHQLRELAFREGRISDEGLLRLLGIDLEPAFRVDRRASPDLIHLEVNCDGPTHRSGARILQECVQLKVVDFSGSKIASFELFQDDDVWPSAPFIMELNLDFKPLGMSSNYNLHDGSALMARVPVFSASEQRRIWNCLRSMANLRKLSLSGYPIDFALVDDMSFAKQLESGTIRLPILLPIGLLKPQKEVFLARASEWAARNKGWHYCIDENCSYTTLPKFELTFRKNA